MTGIIGKDVYIIIDNTFNIYAVCSSRKKARIRIEKDTDIYRTGFTIEKKRIE